MFYVLCFCKRINKQGKLEVLFILKDRPAWQKGKINLPGGRIENGESPVEAAVRELCEETGLIPRMRPFKASGVMHDREFRIYLVEVEPVDPFQEFEPRVGETEKTMWIEWETAKRLPNMMPNLQVIVPMMITGMDNWIIGDSSDSQFAGTSHKITVEVPVYKAESND